MVKVISKRFPANTSLESQTFLNSKKIDGELYAFLQSYSHPDENKRTVVNKKDLPSQSQICSKLGIKSPKTYRSRLTVLIDQGYVIEESSGNYILPEKEEIFLHIPLETVKFLNDTLKEQVVKIYIYLGQRFKYKPGYVFTIAEIGAHIGIKLDNNSRNYEIINNALICLKNNGLIDYIEYYEEKVPKKRLTNFSFTHLVR